MATTLLIDGGVLARETFEATGACDGFETTGATLAERVGADRVVVAWDGKGSKRVEWFPPYKAKRRERREVSPDKENYAAYCAELERVKAALSFEQAWSDGWEGDDVLAALVCVTEGDCVIYSSDHDLHPLLVEGRVFMLHPREDVPVRGEDLFAREGLYPAEAHSIACLRGCECDEIPGVKGVGLVWATKIVRACPDVVEMLRRGEDTAVRTAVMRNCDKAMKKAEEVIKNKNVVFETEKLVKLYDGIELQRKTK
jgi:5'-3' exonuclease